MKRFFLLLACMLMFAVAVPVQATDTVRLSTGAVGGTYYDVLGVNLRNVLRDRNLSVEIQESAGSVENLNNIDSQASDVGFTQADALAGWLRGKPAADVEILGSLGQECIYIVSSKDANITSIQDLVDPGRKIAVGNQGSGSAQSWDFIRTLNTDYAETQTFYQGGVRAMGQVQTGQLDAFLWVTSPSNRSHRFLEAALMEDGPFQFVEIDDSSLASTLPNGQAVYTQGEIVGRENSGWFSSNEKVDTLCTDLMVVADYNMDSGTLETLATAIMMDSNRIIGR